MKIFAIFMLSLFYVLQVSAATIDITQTPQSLLDQSNVYYDQKNLSFENVKEQSFTPLNESYINRAFDAKTTAWIHLSLYNPSDEQLKVVLEVNNPRLEQVTLFNKDKQELRGMLHVNKKESHIYPSFKVTLRAQEHRDVWLKVRNTTTALQFEVTMKSPLQYHSDDHSRQNSIVFFLGVLCAFLGLSLMLYIYLKDDSYLYYALYLMTLIFQQMTYVGFLPLYAPQWFIEIDNLIAVPKISLMIIAAAWYAMHFLKTKRFPKIHRTYQSIIVVIFMTMPIVGTPYFYYPEVSILIGLGFIIFNTVAGIYVYTQGTKQARFFIAGWLVLIVAYLLMIADALGAINGMHKLPSLLLWATSLEALFLLLAFVDWFALIQFEKEQLHDEFIREHSIRQKIIEAEVEEKTTELSLVLKQKQLLFKELHHRVKNNLQLILSLLRLQADKGDCGEGNTVLGQLEGRVLAIARTHELLNYESDVIDIIDMQEYVENYLEEMENTLDDNAIQFHCNIDAELPLKEATYVGLVINELVTNAIKYAFSGNGGNITINLKKEDGKFHFEVSDDGRGYQSSEVSSISLGLSLVRTLIEEQLEGTIEYKKSSGSQYVMRFGI